MTSTSTRTLLALSISTLILAHAPAPAGAQEAEMRESSAKEKETDGGEACVPACRAGFLCRAGTCVSACNPPCPESEVCTGAGACVSRCNPACAANEVCTPAGECVSACNPPCAAGQRCTPGGACTGSTSGPALEDSSADPGWSRKAGTFGVVTASLLAGATVGLFVADAEDSNGLGLGIGIPATLLGGIAIPVIAAGGRSARETGEVEGSPGLRGVGWVLYGVSLADALALIGLTLADAAPDGIAGSVGLLGTASTIAFTSDAYLSAAEAETEGTVNVSPSVGLAEDGAGQPTTTLGVRISF